MMNWYLSIVRGVQAVFAIIILGLSAYVANWWSGYWHAYSPSEVNFIVFSAVWTLLALVYLFLAPTHLPKFAHVYAILAVEVLTMIFWFAGFIALAVFLSDRVCFGSVCSCAKAACVFAAFEWALFVYTTAFGLSTLVRARREGSHSTKPSGSVVGAHSGV